MKRLPVVDIPSPTHHVEEIKEYLKALDLIVNVPNETIIPSGESLENFTFTQPGMRYCQAQALVHALSKAELFASLSEQEKKLNQTSRRLGKIKKRYVLYRGEDTVLENGIEYRNVEEYLKQLWN